MRVCVASIMKIAALFALVAAFTGCTAGGSSSGLSAVQLALPPPPGSSSSEKLSAKEVTQSVVTKYTRVMINVRGSGINGPIVQIWNGGDDSPSASPDSFNLDIPRGSSRLVQVLAITRDFTMNGTTVVQRGAQKFYYGDATADMTGATVGLDLLLAPVAFGTGANVGDSIIAGRYLTDAQNGPTGGINVNFAPPNGSPPMTVTRSEMHGGWFSLISFEGTRFSYVMDSGLDLFGTSSITEIANKVGTDASRMLVRVPNAYQTNSNNVRQVQGTALGLLGYFGPGAPGKKMYYYPVADTISNLYLSSSSSDTTLIKWLGTAGAVPSATTPFAGVVSGGASDVANCAATSFFDSCMRLNHTYLRDMHSVMGLQGPFHAFVPLTSSSPTMLDAQVVAGVVTMEWRYLPGVLGNGRVVGVDVFARTLANTPSNNGDPDFVLDGNIQCDRLTDATYLATTFSKVGSASAAITNAVTGAQVFAANSISVTDFYAGKVQIALCPYDNNGKHFVAGTYYSRGGDQGPNTATKILAMGPNLNPALSSFQTSTNVCTPVSIRTVNSAGDAAYLVTTDSITAQIKSGAAVLYQDQDCSSNYTAGDSLNFMGNDRILYAKSSSNGTSVIGVSTTSSGLTSTLSLVAAPAATGAVVNIAGLPSSIYASSCYPVSAYFTGASGQLATPISFSLSSSSAPLKLFSDNACTQNGGYQIFQNPVSPYLATSALRLFAKYEGSASAAPTDMSGGISASSYTISIPPAAVTLPGAISQMTVTTPQTLQPEMCTSAIVQLQDSQGHAVSVTGTTVALNVTSSGPSGVQPYMNSGCMTTSTPPINVGSSAVTLYFRPKDLVGSYALTVSAPTLSISANAPYTLSGGPAATQVLMAMTGQSFVDGSGITGTATTPTAGVPYTITLIAVSYYMHKATSFNTTCATTDLSANPTTIDSAVTFLAGVGVMSNVIYTSGGPSALNMNLPSCTNGAGTYSGISANQSVYPP